MENLINIENVTRKELINWGIYPSICREKIIDQKISILPKPNSDLLKAIKKKWCERNKIDSDLLLRKWLEKKFLSFNQWEKTILREWYWSQWCLKNFEKKISNYFLERKKSLDTVVYSFLRVKKKDFAEELYLQIKENEKTFKEIALNFSEGGESQKGGLIGPLEINKLNPFFIELLKISNKGEILPPQKFKSWWILFRLEKIEMSRLDENMSLKLSLELGEKFIINELKKYLREPHFS